MGDLTLIKVIFKYDFWVHWPPPLHSDQYYTNTSSVSSMKNVLVLTMPNTRSYTINTDPEGNNTVRTQDFKITQLPRSL